MILRSLFDPLGVLVLLAILAMSGRSALWFKQGQRAFDQLTGALKILRRVAGELAVDHPIRRRLESAPIVDLSFEEITRLMTGDAAEPAARSLVRLSERIGWIERFAQFSVHLGILGTVFALVNSDPTDLDSFRASLPTALGTTFWGLIGALLLSAIAGGCDSLIERSRHAVRLALLEGLERPPDGIATVTSDRGVEDE
jgi:hypothetical protein